MVPLLLTVAIFALTIAAQVCASDNSTKARIRNNGLELFLALTFFVFASVSQTIFNTFNCVTYGDDPVLYLAVDESLSCETEVHQKYQKFAMVMALFYPLGIPILYAYMLFRNMSALKESESLRLKNPNLVKMSFLFYMYESHVWWFELFECVRRLAMTSLLVFIEPGTTSQILIALLLATGSVVAFTHFRPYIDDSDDNLATACQISIWFTIFGCLLVRIGVDKQDEYDQVRLDE